MKKIVSLICAVTLITSVFAQKLDRSIRPSAAPAPEIKLGKIESFTLENGLKVFVVENHKLPKVSYSLTIDVDPLLEGDMAGYIGSTGELLGRGTTNMSKQEIDQEIDFIGATLSTNAGGAYASSLKKHQDKLLAIMSDVILNADFKQEELDKIKKQMISGIASEKDNPDAIAGNVKSALLFGNKHPYGEITTEATVGNVTLEKCKEYYTTYFKPNVAYMAVVGDITVEEAKKNVERYFGTWKKGEVPTNKYRTPQAPAKTQVAFVHKEGSTQSVINITYPINLKQNNPDVVKAKVMNAILGGGSFSARLMSNLREDKAYTYGCYSSISSDEIMGSFSAGGSFRNEVTDSAITQILMEINLISNDLVKDTELDLVKKSMTGSFARSLEDPQTVARFALNTIRFDLPANYYSTYLQKLEKITKNDLMMVANEYLAPKKLNIVVVGNSEVADKLAKFDTDGKVNFKDAFGKNVIPLKSVKEGVTAETVIANYLSKVFVGTEKDALAKKLKSIGYLEVTAVAFIKEMNANVTLTSYASVPNKSATIVKMGPTVAQKTWFNGVEGGSFAMMQGKTELTDEEVKEKQDANFPFSQMFYFTNEAYNIELLGIAEINGADCYKIKVSKEGEDDFVFEYYNVLTGLLDLEERFSTDEEGNPVEVKMYFSDYKLYGKKKTLLLLPGKNVMDMPGQKMEFVTKEVIIKKKSKSSVFNGDFK